MDVRGCYTAMAVAYMLGLDVQELAAASNLATYVKSCQVSLNRPAQQSFTDKSAISPLIVYLSLGEEFKLLSRVMSESA